MGWWGRFTYAVERVDSWYRVKREREREFSSLMLHCNFVSPPPPAAAAGACEGMESNWAFVSKIRISIFFLLIPKAVE